MINDIIDYAKISKNKLNINPSSFSLDLVVNVNFKPILKEVMELLRLQAQEKGIEMMYLNSFSGDELYNDPNRLK